MTLSVFYRKILGKFRIARIKSKREILLGKVAAHKIYLLRDTIEDEVIHAERNENKNDIDVAQGRMQIIDTILGYVQPKDEKR